MGTVWKGGVIMKVIPTYTHGIIDYIVGIALLFAPNLFGFAEVGGAAVLIPPIIGVIILLQALVTNYELGLVKVIPMPTHLTLDYVIGIFLAISPWLFGFARLAANAWAPHLIVGLAILLVAALSERVPRARRVDVPAH
jgi:hypothetical protein